MSASERHVSQQFQVLFNIERSPTTRQVLPAWADRKRDAAWAKGELWG